MVIIGYAGLGRAADPVLSGCGTKWPNGRVPNCTLRERVLKIRPVQDCFSLLYVNVRLLTSLY